MHTMLGLRLECACIDWSSGMIWSCAMESRCQCQAAKHLWSSLKCKYRGLIEIWKVNLFGQLACFGEAGGPFRPEISQHDFAGGVHWASSSVYHAQKQCTTTPKWIEHLAPLPMPGLYPIWWRGTLLSAVDNRSI